MQVSLHIPVRQTDSPSLLVKATHTLLLPLPLFSGHVPFLISSELPDCAHVS